MFQRRGLGSNRSGASALLQKVNAQLSGKRVPIEQKQSKDDGLGDYLSGLTKKSGKELKWDNLDDLSDISISNDEIESQKETEPSPASKFLKKKPQGGTISGQEPKNKSPGASNLAKTKSTSSALNKAALFTSTYSKKQHGPEKKNILSLSDSDMDMDISMDSEIVADVEQLRQSKAKTLPLQSLTEKSSPKKKSVTPQPASRSSGLSFMKKGITSSSNLSFSAQSDSDSSIGKSGTGNRFMKKKSSQPTQGKNDKDPLPKKPSYKLPSSEKHATTVKLDTDEESLADFIGGLSETSQSHKHSPKTLHKSGSQGFRSPKSLGKLVSPEPMGYIREDTDENSISSSISEDFQFNVLDLESLQPVVALKNQPNQSKKVSERKLEKKLSNEGNLFGAMGLQSVDDLLGAGDSVMKDVSEVLDDVTYEPDFEMMTNRSATPLRSILSPTPRPPTPKSSRARVRLALDDVHEVRSRSPSPEAISTARATTSIVYTEDFDDQTEDVATDSSETSSSQPESESSDIRTVTESRYESKQQRSLKSSEGDYSEDFTSEISSRNSRTSRRKSSLSRSLSADSTSYTEDYTSDTQSSDRSRSPSPRPKNVETKSMEVQTSEEPGLWYHWNLEGQGLAFQGRQFGLESVDPTPIASHVIDADQLEALTSYSPSVVALNDMIKQQLHLTKQFMDTQRHIHRSLLGNMEPDYEYTTLQDTKQYIKKERRKRKKLTFEDALKEVKLEMGLDVM